MTSSEPHISIIIPNFNRGELLSSTLDSIISQSYYNWEVLVVDDGSTDNSIEVGLKYAGLDKRITIIKRDRVPSGAPVCRNIGLEKSTGDYIIFLDSDDIMAEGCLEQRANIIKQDPDNDFWVFPMWVFTDKPNEAKNVWNIETSQSDLSRFLSLDAVWQTSGPIWNKKVVQQIGAFNEKLTCWQDVDIHIKALSRNLRYKKYYSLTPDIYYRQHKEGSISQGEISSFPKLESRLTILKNHYYFISEKNDCVDKGFKVMAQSIAIGSARTMHRSITKQIIDFGVLNNLLDKSTIKKTKFIQRLVLTRLNRIGIINKFILKGIKKYQSDSNIGKHLPQTIANENKID